MDTEENEIHPADAMAARMEVEAGDPSECIESMIENLLPSERWDMDDASGEDYDFSCTLKEEHRRRILVKPTDLEFVVFTSVDYRIPEEETHLCVFFDLYEGEHLLSSDHAFECTDLNGFADETKVMTIVDLWISDFKSQLSAG